MGNVTARAIFKSFEGEKKKKNFLKLLLNLRVRSRARRAFKRRLRTVCTL